MIDHSPSHRQQPSIPKGRSPSLSTAIFVIIFLLAVGTPGFASECSEASIRKIVKELQVRDFLNRLPPGYRSDATTLASHVEVTSSEVAVDLPRLINLLESALEQDLPQQAQRRVEEWLQTAEGFQSEGDPQRAVGSGVEAFAHRIDAALSAAIRQERSSIMEYSESRAALLETYRDGLGSCFEVTTEPSYVDVETFSDELSSFDLHSGNPTELIETAQDSSRSLRGCSEEELYRALQKHQYDQYQIHDEDDRALLPPFAADSPEPILHGEGCAESLKLERNLTDSVGVLVHARNIKENGAIRRPTMVRYQELRNLCEDQLFLDVPAIPDPVCTAFVVDFEPLGSSRTILATARHCLDGLPIEEVFFVRNFRQPDENPPNPKVLWELPLLEVVEVSSEVAARGAFAVQDWALLELKSPLLSVRGLPLRREGSIERGEKLLVLGHPDGLPLIAASNAEVKSFGPRHARPFVFGANIDSLGGNSGSPVLNLCSGVVEGVLVSQHRRKSFQDADGCNRILPCKELKRDCQWETVSRIEDVVKALEGIVESSTGSPK